MTELVIPDVIPDGIEPLIKWKAFTVSKQYDLHSPQKFVIWPARERLEASCDASWDYGWAPVRGMPNLPVGWDEEQEQATTFNTTSGAVSTSVFTFFPMSDIPARPRIELPGGMSWSWEAQPHQVVGHTCHCGIYGVDDAEACLNYCLDNRSVICTVAMWGRIIPADRGARAQYAYPQTIEFAKNLSSSELVKLAERYGLTLPNSGPYEIKENPRRLTSSKVAFPKPIPVTFDPTFTETTPTRVTWSMLGTEEELGAKKHATVNKRLGILLLSVSVALLLTLTIMGDSSHTRPLSALALITLGSSGILLTESKS